MGIIETIFVILMFCGTIGLMVWREYRTWNDTGFCDRAEKKLVKRILKEIKARNVFAYEKSNPTSKEYWYEIEIPKKNSHIKLPAVYFMAEYDVKLDCYSLKYIIPNAKSNGDAVQDFVCCGTMAKKVWDALMVSYPRTDHIQEKKPKLNSRDDCIKYLNKAIRAIGKERKKIQKEKKW